jgi:DNA-binding MarR family transcriptional regulator
MSISVEPGGSGIPRRLLRTARATRTAFDRRMAEFDLTFQQAALLIRCSREPGARVQDLLPYLGVDGAAVTRLIDRLEAADLVARRAGKDRRSISLQPTPAGAALVPRLRTALEQLDRQVVQGFSESELRQLSEMLGRIATNVDKAHGT